MEKEQYAAGDQVYIKGSYSGRCSNAFGTLVRKAGSEHPAGTWLVEFADQHHPVHENFFEFKSIPMVPGKPRFKRGDRVVSKCPGHATFNLKGTIEDHVATNSSGELYNVRLDAGVTRRMNLGWLVSLTEDGPTYKEGDKVSVKMPSFKQASATIESYKGKNYSGKEVYSVRSADGGLRTFEVSWLDAPQPEPKYKEGDLVEYINGPYAFTGVVSTGISDFPNKDGEYVYLVRDVNGTQRWCAEVFLKIMPPQKKPDTFKDQLQPGDRVKLRYNHNCGTVVGRETDPGFIERYHVKWDKTGKVYTESRRSLEVLHAPRSTDDPLPAQAEIDAIDRLREPLIAQVEELQGKLRLLNQAKAKLKQL